MSAPAPARASAPLITPILVAGAAVLIISFGARAAGGVFQIPVAETFGWMRTEYSIALAISNLAWGLGAPLFGAIAERYGERLAMALGTACYAGGLALSGLATSPEAHQVLNFWIGMGAAGTGFGVVLAVVGRAASDENRSMALAIVSALGSVGQITFPPATEALVAAYGWQAAFYILAAVTLLMLTMLPVFPSGRTAAAKAAVGETLGKVAGRAFRDPSYSLIFLGFFSCGYQIGFMTSHLPAFVTEACAAIDPSGVLASLGISTTSALGAWAIGIIGLMNIVGTLTVGKLGNMFPKKYLLSAIYMGRVIVCSAFILIPMTPFTVIVFAACMGALWLASVPLTAGLVGYIYGLRYMGTLYGIIFLSHQIGAFIGIWLGGALFDRYGSYDLVWWVGIGVGLFSAIVHLPIRETPLDERRGPAAPPGAAAA
ncbi:MAG: MFS transporter [Pseudomonadota bacterium]